jgi:hypothetical protein
VDELAILVQTGDWPPPKGVFIGGRMKRVACSFGYFFGALLVLLANPAAAQWASVGDMPAPRREVNTLTFQNADHGDVAGYCPGAIHARP